MGEYDVMDKALAGALSGLSAKVNTGLAKANIEFGYPVFGYVGDGNACYPFKKDTGKIVFDGDFVASNVITITVNGEDAADVTFDTDHDTTAALVVNAVNALDGVECVLDPADTNNRTFLILVKGATAVVAEAITGGAGQVTGTITYDTAQVFLGIAQRTENAAGLYETYDSVNIVEEGDIYAVNAGAVASNMAGYVADSGKLAAAGTSINVRFLEDVAADGLANTNVEGGQNLGLSAKFA